MTLDDLKIGETAIIVKADSRRMEKGFIPGQEIRLLGYSLMNDPIRVLVMGTHWAIRRADAKKIEVKEKER